MVYETFLEAVKQNLQEVFGSGYRLEIHPVPKNNGVMLDGISILAPDSPMAPTVYLNPYYEQYCNHLMSLEDICADITQLFENNPPPDSIRTDDLSDFEKIRSRIMMKLIHTDSNKELLSDIPHIPYLDLSIVFYLFLERSESGQMTALIHNSHIYNWNISDHELLRLALDNTPVYFPARLCSMSDILKDIAHQNIDCCDEDVLDRLLEEEALKSPLYVLTNESGIYGAICMLYRDELKNFANKLNQDLIIIPSSVHEVLLAPLGEDTSYDELNSMVVTINQNEVSPEDQLSNHVYRYERSTDCISIALGPASDTH